jgi:type II secretion system protein G
MVCKVKLMVYSRNCSYHGFTLLELLAVITIIGVLATLALFGVNDSLKRGRDSRRISDLQSIRAALEQYYLDNGTYPASPCGVDCNGYHLSCQATWGTLGTELAPYLQNLPKDPKTSSCGGPWTDNFFNYAYGNVFTNPPQYDLTAQLESKRNPERCEVKNWRFYSDDRAWCTAHGGQYSNQVYEASQTGN